MGNAKGYLVFDIESVSDIDLIARVRHPGGDTSPEEALRIFREEQMEKKGSDFIPYTYQVPISLVIAVVNGDLAITKVECLKWEDGGPKKIAEDFWNLWRERGKPTFVTFNGRGFDIPMMEMMAFRYGIPVPEWFEANGSYSPRNRYNTSAHLDLYEFMSNFGSSPINGGLDLSAKVLQKPGKIDTHGDMVQDMFMRGEYADIHGYCFCDVIDTYFVFLRCKLLTGEITPEREAELIRNTRQMLTASSGTRPPIKKYLEAWAAAESAETVEHRMEQKAAQAEQPVSP